jgi:hypothetical protein
VGRFDDPLSAVPIVPVERLVRVGARPPVTAALLFTK